VWDSNFRPTHVYTVAEYAALGKTEQRYELQEGHFVVLPGPSPRHMKAVMALAVQLRVQLPRGIQCVPDAELDLGLVAPGVPGTVRRPDLVAVGDSVGGGLLRAADVRLVIEVAAPGSYRMDYQVKRSEYADAGIPHYWVIDVASPVSLVAFELSDGEYADSGKTVGKFTAEAPFEVTVDLPGLVT
jgi:Uma2 family endonuclease